MINKITALYERLSHDDELKDESNSILIVKDISRIGCDYLRVGLI